MHELEQVLKALADSKRLRIVSLLLEKRLCVCELAAVLGITQPSVSRHLKKLKRAGIVAGEQQGFWTNYYLAPSNEYANVLVEHLNRWRAKYPAAQVDENKFAEVDRHSVCLHNR